LQCTDTADAITQRHPPHDALPTCNSTLEVLAYVIHDGNSGGNYAVSAHTHSGTITAAALDIYAVGDSKSYDASTSSNGVPTLGAGQLQGSDTVDGLTQRYQSKNVMGAGNSTLELLAYVI